MAKRVHKKPATSPGLTYAQSGVQYHLLDPLKRLAQDTAASTSHHLSRFGQGFQEISASRGESAYVWQEGESYRAMVIEGLGTKNRVADAYRARSGRTHYDAIAQDTVAMIINDLIVVGARPQVVTAYFAVGNSEWFSDEQRTQDLVSGWAQACNQAGAVWGGGETPTLKTIIEPDTIDLAGAAVGLIHPHELVLGDKLQAGDAIVLIASNGIHANGLTMARAIADRLPDGYATKLSDGLTYGEALLQPTHLYAALVEACLDAKIVPHYMVNITGHGWRKLMRATQPFTYRLETIPEVPALFHFIQTQAGSSDQEMYGNFNMGAGFAMYVRPSQVKKLTTIATQLGLTSWLAGVVETGPKRVIIAPKQIEFAETSLEVR